MGFQRINQEELIWLVVREGPDAGRNHPFLHLEFLLLPVF